MERTQNTQYVLSLSYGKDSIAAIEACFRLGYPIDRIVHAEIWATDTISADLPPMLEFKSKADAIIKARYGLTVEHVCAMRGDEKMTYEKLFYHVPKRKKPPKYAGGEGSILGFPIIKGNYCTSRLKNDALCTGFNQWISGSNADLHKRIKDIGAVFSIVRREPGAKTNTVQYLGIAVDEPIRIQRHTKPGFVLPLVDIGWTEAECRTWCAANDLLSPIYTTATRGGCWFCHNQSVGQLRLLRKNYPDLWALLLRWDADSPVSFHADGHTVRDFDRRFALEDEGAIRAEERFSWDVLNKCQLNVFMFLGKGENDNEI